MFVGTAEIELSIPAARSLKDKRQVVKSIIEKIKHRFNASIAEVGYLDTWKTALIGVSCVSNNKTHVEEMIQNVVDFMENDDRAIVIGISTDVF
jgi:uncharacterized protein YlxP (DUF503 family)